MSDKCPKCGKSHPPVEVRSKIQPPAERNAPQ